MFCSQCGKETPEGQTICENCINKIQNNNEKNKFIIKKPIKIVIIIILVIILLSVIITIMLNLTFKKTNNLKENIETNNSIENKNESIIIFDDSTSTGATFNIKREDIDNAIKSAYQGSQCEKLIGEFGSNNSEWTKVDDGISNYAMYFYIPAIDQKLREMGASAFKIGICVTPNNYIQSITLHSAGRTGVITDYTVSEIIKYNSIYEEFYHDILKKLFNDDYIIQNMNKVENANKVNGIGTGGIIIKDNITYSYLVQLAEGTNMYSKQYSIGAVGNEKAKEMEDAYKGYNIYIDADDSKTNNSNNIEQMDNSENMEKSDIQSNTSIGNSQSNSSSSSTGTNNNFNSNNNSTQNTTIEQIKLPNLINLTEAEAIKKLESLGLKYSITSNTKQVPFDNPNAGKSIVTNIIDKKDYYSQYDRVHLEVNQYQESGISIGFIINTKEVVNYVNVYIDNKKYSAYYFPNMLSETFYANGRKSVNIKIVLNNYFENFEIYNKNVNLYKANKTVSDYGHTTIDIGTIDYKS